MALSLAPVAPSPTDTFCCFSPLFFLGTCHCAGDNSNSAQGKFYEGIMVTGATSDATDELVQANIVAVGYAKIQ